jgi:hypothetical protein
MSKFRETFKCNNRFLINIFKFYFEILFLYSFCYLKEMESQKTLRTNLKAYSFLNQILAEGGSVDIALKSEIDYLHGRNEELTNQILIFKAESNKAQVNFLKAQDEIDRLNSDVRLMNNKSAAKDIFQPFKLPPGMAPSSQDIISALNEYLIDTLQV